MRPAIILALILALGACASHQAREIPPFVFDRDVYRIEVRDVVIGVEPYSDPETIEQAFDVDMSKGGYFPIRLSISNLSENRLVIERPGIHLVDADEVSHHAISGTDVFEDLRHNSALYGALGFGWFSFNSAENANASMRADWESKELPESMFFGRGQKQEGFVYVKLPEGMSPGTTTIEIPIELFGTGDKFSMRTRLQPR